MICFCSWTLQRHPLDGTWYSILKKRGDLIIKSKGYTDLEIIHIAMTWHHIVPYYEEYGQAVWVRALPQSFFCRNPLKHSTVLIESYYLKCLTVFVSIIARTQNLLWSHSREPTIRMVIPSASYLWPYGKSGHLTPQSSKQPRLRGCSRSLCSLWGSSSHHSLDRTNDT